MEIWQSTDGLNWIRILSNGFGDFFNGGTMYSNATTIFHGSLYLGTWNGSSGGEAWQFLQYQTLIPLIVK